MSINYSGARRQSLGRREGGRRAEMEGGGEQRWREGGGEQKGEREEKVNLLVHFSESQFLPLVPHD